MKNEKIKNEKRKTGCTEVRCEDDEIFLQYSALISYLQQRFEALEEKMEKNVPRNMPRRQCT